jgi:excisionase family DNA binding protein
MLRPTVIDRPFLTVTEMAALLGVAKKTIERAIRAKRIPYVKIGRSVRIHRDVVKILTKQAGAK